jgi:hypothetical protein
MDLSPGPGRAPLDMVVFRLAVVLGTAGVLMGWQPQPGGILHVLGAMVITVGLAALWCADVTPRRSSTASIRGQAPLPAQASEESPVAEPSGR